MTLQSSRSPSGGMPRWAVISVAINLFLMGWICSQLLSAHPMMPPPMMPEMLAAGGPPGMPPPMAEALKDSSDQLSPHFKKIKMLQGEMQQLVRQPTFNRTALEAKVAEVDAEMNAVKGIVQHALLDKLSRLPQAERARIADMLPN